MALEMPPDQPSPGKAPQKVAERSFEWYLVCHQSSRAWPLTSMSDPPSAAAARYTACRMPIGIEDRNACL